VAGRIKGAQFVLPVSYSKFTNEIKQKLAGTSLNIKVIEGSSYDVIANSDLVIAKSGTIILECVCLNTPVIMFYKLSPLTYFIGRYLLGIKLAYYSMPNILAGRMVVPEYVMGRANADNIYNEAVRILADPEKAKAGYAEVRSLLGNAGASAKAAGKIIEFIGKT
jgi:lipid-A-disaccharide synthase